MPASDTFNDIVIIGAGQAGLTPATSLRENGWPGAVSLIGAEDGEPYQRPPLSKGYLAGVETDSDLTLRTREALLRENIDYRSGESVVAVDRDDKVVLLTSGAVLRYGRIIFATGSRARYLPVPGSGLHGVRTLRTRLDSTELKDRIAGSERLTVAGGGFLGLEVAATAAKAGRQVTVLERFPRLLQRAIGPITADHLAHLHRTHGVDIRCHVGVEEFTGDNGRVQLVVLDDGTTVPADLVLVAIGAAPTTEVAEQAGLDVADGIVVNHRLQTSDPNIFAVGDCARHPSLHADASIRLESVQNAVDQARHVVAQLTGATDSPYSNVPWFWSQQYDRKLQITGLALPSDTEIPLHPSKETGFAVARERHGRLVAVETINDPKIHLRARRLLANGPVDLAQINEIAPPAHPVAGRSLLAAGVDTAVDGLGAVL